MALVLLVTLVAAVLLIAAFAGGFQSARNQHARQADALASLPLLREQHRVKHALADPAGRMIGLRPAEETIHLKLPNGEIHDFNYSKLRAVTLTPVTEMESMTSGETVTHRGSQIISAGLGAMLAGPTGAIVGGLTSPQQHSSTTTDESWSSDLILELFLKDEDLPRFELHASGGSSVVSHPMEEAFKDMAARLANIVEDRSSNS